MSNRKEMKKAAKLVLKKHRFFLILVSLITIMSTTGGLFSIIELNAPSEVTGKNVNGYAGMIGINPNLSGVFDELIKGNEKKSEEIAQNKLRQEENKDAGPFNILGRSKGVLAKTVNMITSGSVFITIYKGLDSISHSNNVTLALMILGSMSISFLLWFLWENMFSVISARIFLESRIYSKVGIQRFLFLGKVRKWIKVAWIMLVQYIFYALWSITIIGGIIKRYSYYMTPYIVAENPDIGALEAITLSRKMMKGHKWECFINEMSFIPWGILGILTFGIAALFYVNPYKTAFFAEYYTKLRRLAIDKQIENYELLTDKYLFELANDSELTIKYADIIEVLSKPEVEINTHNGILGFIARVFGIVLITDKDEEEYEEWQAMKVKMCALENQIDLESYPERLSPWSKKKSEIKVEKTHYIRHYSIGSLILLFFTLAFIGWVWEVSLHLVSDGMFVNRGVLHGPWLPIYGSGGVMILTVLNKFRSRPLVEFISAIILCGVVEYFTAYNLEMTHNGQRWWNYDGYFLNLNGRICAEGLLVFGMGAMAIVYFVAPFLDELFKKMKMPVLLGICILLVSVYVADTIYSSKYPNAGKGITTASVIANTGEDITTQGVRTISKIANIGIRIGPASKITDNEILTFRYGEKGQLW